MSTAEVERGFSLQALILTDLRGRLNPVQADNLMMVSYHAPAGEQEMDSFLEATLDAFFAGTKRGRMCLSPSYNVNPKPINYPKKRKTRAAPATSLANVPVGVTLPAAPASADVGYHTDEAEFESVTIPTVARRLASEA